MRPGASGNAWAMPRLRWPPGNAARADHRVRPAPPPRKHLAVGMLIKRSPNRAAPPYPQPDPSVSTCTDRHREPVTAPDTVTGPQLLIMAVELLRSLLAATRCWLRHEEGRERVEAHRTTRCLSQARPRRQRGPDGGGSHQATGGCPRGRWRLTISRLTITAASKSTTTSAITIISIDGRRCPDAKRCAVLICTYMKK